MIRLQISLDSEEAEKLARWAAAEMRDPRDQIKFVLLEEMERRGYLLTSQTSYKDRAENDPGNKQDFVNKN